MSQQNENVRFVHSRNQFHPGREEGVEPELNRVEGYRGERVTAELPGALS